MGDRTLRDLQFSAQDPFPPVSDSGSPKGPRNLPQLAFTGNASGSSRTRTPEQCPGHPGVTPPIYSPPLQSTSAIFFFKLCMYVWGMYIYINTYMSYFINIYICIERLKICTLKCYRWIFSGWLNCKWFPSLSLCFFVFSTTQCFPTRAKCYKEPPKYLPWF